MRLDGIHHVTCITGDAPRNVDFYTRVLGLRMVKKTVNQDDPTVYHLFYADDEGTPGSDITFFEYPGARRGHAGDGMVHRIDWRVASDEALDFWEERLASETEVVERSEGMLELEDPEGLRHAFAVVETDDAPLVAEHPEIPGEHALQGFEGVRVYAADPDLSRGTLETTLGFVPEEIAPGRRAARAAAGTTRTTSLPRDAVSAARARFITWRGRRRWRSTRAGTAA